MEGDNSEQNGEVSVYGSRWIIKDNNPTNFVLCSIWRIPMNRLHVFHAVGFILREMDQVNVILSESFAPEKLSQ